MKYFYILLAILVTISSNAQDDTDSQTTTYYLIRHAEKDRSDATNRNPHLNEKGKQRALKWSNVFENIEFDLVYSTDYFRTKETAQPTAEKNHLEVTLYDPRDLNMKQFLESTKGKTVLIVGHSNTTPTFANAILGKEKYSMIEDDNNANLYIITVTDSSISDQLLVIE